MTVTYTTALIVQKRVRFLSASLLTADIEENINQVESIIDSVMKQTARGADADFTFSATKHGILRDCATDYAAYLCIKYDISDFPSVESAEFEINALWNDIQNVLRILSDSRSVEYLKNIA